MGGPKVPIPFSSSTESESVPVRVWNRRHPAFFSKARGSSHRIVWLICTRGYLPSQREMGTPRRRFVRHGFLITLKIAASRREIRSALPYTIIGAALISRLPSQYDWTILRLHGGRAPGATSSAALPHWCFSLLHSHRRRQRHSGRRNQSSLSYSRTIQLRHRICWGSGGSPVSSTASCSRCASASSRTPSARRSAA